MVGEMTKEPVDGDELDGGRSPLLPDRRPTGDLFVCDIFDAAPKGDMASMEHPIFSLSTKPDLRIRRYEHGTRFVEITPSVKGLATVHDRDILIYCISQLIAALNLNQPVSQTVRLKAYDLLVATNRTTGGEAYEGLKAALERLRGTNISTNIITGGEEELNVFGLIENAKIIRQTRDGRMQEVEIKLSDWVFNAIRAKEVLTLNRDYFRLRKPLERRMYELARKHCGQQATWSIGLELLQKKCGSNSTEKEFRRLVRTIAEQDEKYAHFPDYAVTMTDDMVCFANRRVVVAKAKPHSGDLFDRHPNPVVSEKGFASARQAAPRYDIQGLYHEWVGWWRDSGCPELTSPDAAFSSFCRKRHEHAPLA
jgi:plasmid replication initiation protein